MAALERVSIRHLGKGQFRLRGELASLQDFQRAHPRLTNRILNRHRKLWIDHLELNVGSRACEVLGLRISKGSDAARAGHSEADWVDCGAITEGRP